MPPTATDPREPPIRSACAQAFQEITLHYARLNERYAAMDEKLDDISQAVRGNGYRRDSLLARVERLETGDAMRRGCSDRFWRVFGVLAAAGAVGIAAIQLLS